MWNVCNNNFSLIIPSLCTHFVVCFNFWTRSAYTYFTGTIKKNFWTRNSRFQELWLKIQIESTSQIVIWIPQNDIFRKHEICSVFTSAFYFNLLVNPILHYDINMIYTDTYLLIYFYKLWFNSQMLSEINEKSYLPVFYLYTLMCFIYWF